ncbi:MAG: propanediol utilization microcompartment protein PduB [Eubacterium sp.]|nr:propanediol utilization microcompartment protein PduB [Eubacterium sp.]
MNSDYICSVSEYVGTAAACTIGMVIATVDPAIKLLLDIPEDVAAIGIVSSRTGTVAQALAIDDAVKGCQASLLRFEMSIDGGKQCGQGCLFVLAADTVTDARKVVEISLERTDYWMGCLYLNHVGHMEGHVTAHAGQVLHEIFGTPVGKAFGIIGAAPAGIGIVAVDKAMKAAPVDAVWYGSPSHNLLMMNEFSAGLCGDYETVKKAIDVGKETGCQLLNSCGMTPVPIKDACQVCGADTVKASYRHNLK